LWGADVEGVRVTKEGRGTWGVPLRAPVIHSLLIAPTLQGAEKEIASTRQLLVLFAQERVQMACKAMTFDLYEKSKPSPFKELFRAILQVHIKLYDIENFNL